MLDLQSLFYFIKILGIIAIILAVAASFGLPFLLKSKSTVKIITIYPALGLIVLTYLLTITSQFGLPTSAFTKLSYIYLILIYIYVLFKLYAKRVKIFVYLKKNLIKISFIFIIYLVSIYTLTAPMISASFITTVATGNSDSFGYSYTADFLRDDSLKNIDHFRKLPSTPQFAGNVINSYRWAPVLILAYFSTLFNMPSFQIFSLLIAFFLLITPLSILSLTLHRKLKNYFFITLIIVFVLFNYQLIYLVYNSFLGQLLFIAVYPIFFYFLNKIYEQKSKNFLDYIILALIICTMLTIYPEGIFLLAASTAVYLFILLVNNPSRFFLKDLPKIIIVVFIAFILNPQSVFLTYEAISIQSKMIGSAGWSFPRKMSFLDVVGLHSIFIAKPAYFIPANIAIFSLSLFGLIKIKNKILTVVFIINILICLAIWYITKNSYAYFKGTVTVAPIIILFFSAGITFIFHRFGNKYKHILLFLIIFALLSTAWPLFQQFQSNTIMVTKDMASIKNVPISKNYFLLSDNIGDLWSILWLTYFFPQQKIYYPTFRTDYVTTTIPGKDMNITKIPIVYLNSEKQFIEKHFPIKNKIFDSNHYNVAFFRNAVLFEKGFGPNEHYAINKVYRWMTDTGEIRIFNSNQSAKKFCLELMAFGNEQNITIMLDGLSTETLLVPPTKSVQSCVDIKPNSINKLKLIPIDYKRAGANEGDLRNLILNVNNFSFK